MIKVSLIFATIFLMLTQSINAMDNDWIVVIRTDQPPANPVSADQPAPQEPTTHQMIVTQQSLSDTQENRHSHSVNADLQEFWNELREFPWLALQIMSGIFSLCTTDVQRL